MTNTYDWRSAGRTHTWTRGDRLRAARERMEGGPYSQGEFAAMIGFSRNTVVRYEADAPGTSKPLVIIQWARATGFDYEWLQTGEEGGAPDTRVDTIRYPRNIRLAA